MAVRAEHGGDQGDQGGPYYDYGGVWGADPVGETPKPYPMKTASPPPLHWGQQEAESTDDTAYDEDYNEVRVDAHPLHVDLSSPPCHCTIMCAVVHVLATGEQATSVSSRHASLRHNLSIR